MWSWTTKTQLPASLFFSHGLIFMSCPKWVLIFFIFFSFDIIALSQIREMREGLNPKCSRLKTMSYSSRQTTTCICTELNILLQNIYYQILIAFCFFLGNQSHMIYKKIQLHNIICRTGAHVERLVVMKCKYLHTHMCEICIIFRNLIKYMNMYSSSNSFRLYRSEFDFKVP